MPPPDPGGPTAEHRRLQEARERTAHWKRWGPYVSDRAWGTVREDYSPHGTAWQAFPHDHARSRAYRWNEDGLAGICDRHQRICFGVALWNEHDPILKERLFGLAGHEGNHGEDVKEYYFHLDSTPTHSYMKFLYKYPQAEFPYTALVDENRRRGRDQPEFELLDTGVFDDNRYFDVFVEYAKGDVDDILVRITATNRGPDAARLQVLPTIWFRNTWSWGLPGPRPSLAASPDADHVVVLDEPHYGRRWLYCDAGPELLFTENDTNTQRLFGVANAAPFVKDGFDEFVVHGRREAVNPARVGTKAAARYAATIEPGGSFTCRLRFTDRVCDGEGGAFADFDAIFADRQADAEAFYASVTPPWLSPDAQRVMRQAFAGLLWWKQYYHYVIDEWLAGDPMGPTPPRKRLNGRNHQWTHLHNEDVVLMPDKWEYPWYAAWDLAFHCVALALVDIHRDIHPPLPLAAADISHRATAVAGALFLMTGSFVLCKTARDSLYFSEGGLFDLPLAYIGMAVLSMPTALVTLVLMRRLGGRRTRVLAPLAFAACLAALAGVMRPGGGVLMTAIFMLIPLVFGVLFSMTWLLLADLLGGTPASRLPSAYARSAAGSLLGGVVGALLARVSAEALEPTGILLLGAGALAAAAAVIARAQHAYRSRCEPRAVPVPFAQVPVALLADGRFRLVAALAMAAAVAGILVEFQFYAAATLWTGSGPSTTRLFADMYLGLNGIALAAQLTVVPRLQRRMGLGSTLMVLPTAVFVLTSPLFLTASVAGRSALRLVEGSLKSSIHRMGWEQVFAHFPSEHRPTAKMMVDGAAARLAEGAAGLLLYLWLTLVVGGDALTPASLMWLTSVLAVSAAGWMLLTMAMRTRVRSSAGPEGSTSARVPDS